MERNGETETVARPLCFGGASFCAAGYLLVGVLLAEYLGGEFVALDAVGV